ncbi:integrase core domain-containing protein [Actinomadura fibrosa]|uniref:Integrase core domain-containing protein n=1 Tax=Actinomadura fibrosa TaxID=111802 RepID=A0ABW2XYQ5_9ACTN
MRSAWACGRVLLLLCGWSPAHDRWHACLARWLQYYNSQRSHAALGGQPPITRLSPRS